MCMSAFESNLSLSLVFLPSVIYAQIYSYKTAKTADAREAPTRWQWLRSACRTPQLCLSLIPDLTGSLSFQHFKPKNGPNSHWEKIKFPLTLNKVRPSTEERNRIQRLSSAGHTCVLEFWGEWWRWWQSQQLWRLTLTENLNLPNSSKAEEPRLCVCVRACVSIIMCPCSFRRYQIP